MQFYETGNQSAPHFDKLDGFLAKFVNDNPTATIHYRKTPADDGVFRMFFQVEENNNVDSWEEDDSLSDTNLQYIFGAEIQVCLGNCSDFEIYKRTMKGEWVTFAEKDGDD